MDKQHILYGDGIHDDYPAIQEMLDSGSSLVELPAPAVRYQISKTLVISSGCKLKLPRFAHIRLMDNANCMMLQSKTVYKPANRLLPDMPDRAFQAFGFVNRFSVDPEDICHDFEIEGGVWDCNNLNQLPNPQQSKDFGPNGDFYGYGMLFYNVRNFRLANMTLKDPTNYAITLDLASYFTCENITFDFNTGNPYAVNMDGIHLNGNCHYGVIRNLQGACYDDLVALNAHEGTRGDITNLDIDGIFAENCHSAIRLLTVTDAIRNIRIANVYGTYYQYCIGFTKHYPGETTGCFDAIRLENIFAAKAKRLPVQEMHMGDKDYHFPFVWMQGGTVVKHISIHGLHRREQNNPIATVRVDTGAVVERMIVQDVTLENLTDTHCPVLENLGTISYLSLQDVPENTLEGSGSIGLLHNA